MKKIVGMLLALIKVLCFQTALGATATITDAGWDVSMELYNLTELSGLPNYDDITASQGKMAEFAAVCLRDVSSALPEEFFLAGTGAVYISDVLWCGVFAENGPDTWWILPAIDHYSVSVYRGSKATTIFSVLKSNGYSANWKSVDYETLTAALVKQLQTPQETLASEGYESVFRSAKNVYDTEWGWFRFIKKGISGFVSPQGEYLTDNWNYTTWVGDAGYAGVYRGEISNWGSPATDSATHRNKGNYGLIDAQGNYVLPMEYEDLAELDGTIYRLERHDGTFTVMDVADGKQIDVSGYDYVTSGTDDRLVVFKGTLNEYGNADKGLYGLIDKSGRETVPLKYDSLHSIHSMDRKRALFAVKRNGHWGLIDGDGNQVIPCTWDGISDISEKTAIVSKNDKAYLIDLNGGAVLYAFGTKYAYSTERGYTYYDTFENDGGMLDEDLNPVLQREWYSIGHIEGDWYYLCKKDGADGSERHYGVYDRSTGKMVLPVVFDAIDSSFSDGLLRVKQMGYYGYMDRSFRMVIPAAYEDATAFSKGYAAVKEDGAWYIIDTGGKIVY